MMDSFFSILPKGFFGLNQSTDGVIPERKQGTLTPIAIRVLTEDHGRKRSRGDDDVTCASSTPTLVSTRSKQPIKVIHDSATNNRDDDGPVRPVKRFRCESNFSSQEQAASSAFSLAEVKAEPKETKKSPVEQLPEDVVAHCLSFLSGTEDRFSLQCTSKQFQRLSNTDGMLIGVEVGGDRNTGKNGIIRDHDTPDSASDKLTPFAVAGNLEALYM